MPSNQNRINLDTEKCVCVCFLALFVCVCVSCSLTQQVGRATKAQQSGLNLLARTHNAPFLELMTRFLGFILKISWTNYASTSPTSTEPAASGKIRERETGWKTFDERILNPNPTVRWSWSGSAVVGNHVCESLTAKDSILTSWTSVNYSTKYIFFHLRWLNLYIILPQAPNLPSRHQFLCFLLSLHHQTTPQTTFCSVSTSTDQSILISSTFTALSLRLISTDLHPEWCLLASAAKTDRNWQDF